jgi:pyridinium-3,5-biscarboxylic acid mononucleotide sulfurtransferase
MPDAALQALASVLSDFDSIAVAVSGGVDSLTLATFAHRVMDGSVSMYHAVSPAVPEEATSRTRELAADEGWPLHVIDAGEFADPNYRRNPANRCFFCKTNLYGAIAAHTARQIVSGTNLDDLGEFRPGLDAARAYGVRHPYVEAGIDKRTLRRIALALGLGTVAELPAAPCLASRIETGIRIESPLLAMVHQVERLVAETLRPLGEPATVRCRVRAGSVVIELDEATLGRLDATQERHARRLVGEAMNRAGLVRPISFAPYRAGSAFLHQPAKSDAP